MPSKTSKKRLRPPSLWKSALGCAEDQVAKLAQEFALVLREGDRIFLEGEMGAGKTTFARSLLKGLGVIQPPEGSPSFAIAHEYQSPKAPQGGVVHIDFYRLKTESEIQDAGLDAYFWEREAIVISEWISLFPGFEKSLIEEAEQSSGLGRVSRRIWKVSLQTNGSNEFRDVAIQKF